MAEAAVDEIPATNAEPEEEATGVDATADPTTPRAVEGCNAACESTCECRKGINVTPYKNLILLNFGSTLAGRIELEYERALHRIVSIFGGAYAVAFDSLGNENLVGFGIEVGTRVFVLGRAPEGIWFAGTVGMFWRNPRGNRSVKTRGLETGLLVGWTGVWGRFALSLGAGATYNYGRVSVLGQSVGDSEFNPLFKIGIGVAF
ncbi:MAG: hypothetical protein AAGF92_14165 [Myxococcota bacterium]